MKLYIHSSYGVLEAEPLVVQAIEKSIPEETLFKKVQDDTVDSEGAEHSIPL